MFYLVNFNIKGNRRSYRNTYICDEGSYNKICLDPDLEVRYAVKLNDDCPLLLDSSNT